jgi:hypothetical protein
MKELDAEKTRLDASERHKEWCIEKRLGSLEVTEQQVDAEVHRAIQCTVMTAARRGCATSGASAAEVADGVGQLMAGKGPKFEQLKADVKTAFDKERLEYAFSQEVRMENGMAQHGFFERVVAPGSEGLDARTCAGRLHDLADDDLCGTTWTV